MTPCNKIMLTLIAVIFLTATGKAQETFEISQADNDESACILIRDILFIEVSAIANDIYIKDLKAEDFELYYKDENYDIEYFRLGQIISESDAEINKSSITDSTTHYLIGISLDFDEKLKKDDFMVSVSKEKIIKFGQLKIEIRNFLYQ